MAVNPAAFILTVFVILLTLQPYVADRMYAAYGGVFINVALFGYGLLKQLSLRYQIRLTIDSGGISE